MDAATKVFQNFELVEAILLRAETYEILTATSVCTSWRAVVENSKALRTYISTLSIRKPGRYRPAFDSPPQQLNASANDVWHFSVKTANSGTLFVMRFPREDVEIFLLAPVQKGSHLKVLDDAYDMYAVTTDFKPDLEFRTKSGEKVCRTKCKAVKLNYSESRWMWTETVLAPKHVVVCINLLMGYLSTFYADQYGPGIKWW